MCPHHAIPAIFTTKAVAHTCQDFERPSRETIREGAGQLRAAPDRALCLERFLDAEQFDPALFSGRSLYLLPDGLAE
jgi:hypothetical protein